MRVSQPDQGVLPLLGTVEIRAGLARPSLDEVVSLAVALGAAETGGPLSPEERRLVGMTARPSEDVEEIRDLILQGLDPLGEAMSAFRSTSDRRALGAFYTPPENVEAMVAWSLAQERLPVLYPGCRSGRFAARAIPQSPETQVVAVDVAPVATLVCRAVLA